MQRESYAVKRARAMAEHLRMEVRCRVASGRYLQGSTGHDRIDAIVFHRGNEDCVGFTARGDAMAFLNQNERRWTDRRFTRHQATPNSHKTAATFIKKFDVPTDGSFDPGLSAAFDEVFDIFGKAGPRASR